MFPTPLVLDNNRTVQIMFTQQREDGMTEVEWTDVIVRKLSHGLEVGFRDGNEYLYPWHTIKRVRITGVEHGDTTES